MKNNIFKVILLTAVFVININIVVNAQLLENTNFKLKTHKIKSRKFIFFPIHHHAVNKKQNSKNLGKGLTIKYQNKKTGFKNSENINNISRLKVKKKTFSPRRLFARNDKSKILKKTGFKNAQNINDISHLKIKKKTFSPRRLFARNDKSKVLLVPHWKKVKKLSSQNLNKDLEKVKKAKFDRKERVIWNN